MSAWETEMKKYKELNKGSESMGTINYINIGNMGAQEEKREKKKGIKEEYLKKQCLKISPAWWNMNLHI